MLSFAASRVGICGNDINVELHHPRMTVGLGQKCDDDLAVPLCGRHHRQLHRQNETEFWLSYNIDPALLAKTYQGERGQ